MKVRILIDDPIDRFKAGEIGEVLSNDSKKYDFYVKLPGTYPFTIAGRMVQAVRIYYFYKEEVEVIEQ